MCDNTKCSIEENKFLGSPHYQKFPTVGIGLECTCAKLTNHRRLEDNRENPAS